MHVLQEQWHQLLLAAAAVMSNAYRMHAQQESAVNVDHCSMPSSSASAGPGCGMSAKAMQPPVAETAHLAANCCWPGCCHHCTP